MFGSKIHDSFLQLFLFLSRSCQSSGTTPRR